MIPAGVGAHAGLGGAVAIADTEGAATLVYEDGFTAGRTSALPEVVTRARQVAAVLLRA